MLQISKIAVLSLMGALIGQAAIASTPSTTDLLVKFKSPHAAAQFSAFGLSGVQTDPIDAQWIHVTAPSAFASVLVAGRNGVEFVQPNYAVHLLENYRTQDPAVIKQIKHDLAAKPLMARADNPDFPASTRGGGSGPDPLASSQWGMIDIGSVAAQKAGGTGKGIIVAVIDTGVDYTHEDLMDNLWKNPGEAGIDASGRDRASNGIDDDSNGFVDDVIGWDFATNDNKPYDLAGEGLEVLMGKNPGHGTHCAGNVAAVGGNGKGIAGVAPEAKIMAIRFLNEKGQGDSAGAIKAINYAVKMGAKVLSNSWGSEGEEDTNGNAGGNIALREAITNAEKAGVLFVAAAGNGHKGVGYDNDSDPKPGMPASYPYSNIVSVAALDSNNALGAFSNWGARTVHLAAPGVKVFSTMVDNKYSDVVVDMYGMKATWDGTSMACPHVAGAAAAYWSKHPSATYADVKAALLASVKPVSALTGKVMSGGKLNVEALLAR